MKLECKIQYQAISVSKDMTNILSLSVFDVFCAYVFVMYFHQKPWVSCRKVVRLILD